MKYFLLVLGIIVLIYLNRSYAFYYNHFAKNPLNPPVKITQEEKKEKPKFVTLGDSLFYGLGSSSTDKTLSFLLYKSLDQNEEMEFVNPAVSGATVEDVLKKQLPKISGKNPKEIIIFIGVNDVHNGTPIEDFEINYRKLLEDLTLKTQAKIVLINIPYLGSEKILLPPWNTYIDSQTKHYNLVIKKLSEEFDLKLVDLYTGSRDDFIVQSNLYSEDQFHPSDAGYALWASIILEELKNEN